MVKMGRMHITGMKSDRGMNAGELQGPINLFMMPLVMKIYCNDNNAVHSGR